MAGIAQSEPMPIPSVKDLASSESSIRRSSLKTIITHLNERAATSPLTATQALQLWRGLYVSIYMHDSKNAVSVQKLIAEITGLIKVAATKDAEIGNLEDQNGIWLDTWTTAFWETISREWVSIDQWRMNKVMLLVRFFLREVFQLALVSVSIDDSDAKFDSSSLITRQIQVLETWPLSPRERKVPDGLRLHVLDVWSDELMGQLNAVQNEADDSAGYGENSLKATLIEAVKKFMIPVETISKEALSRGVKTRGKEALRSFRESIQV